MSTRPVRHGTPLADRFAEIDADPGLARTWFASLLRDGFALAVNDVNPSFGALAAEQLHILLGSLDPNRDLDNAVAHVLGGFAELRCHPDVAVGINALSTLGLRLVTLTNGATSVAQGLLNDAGLIDAFELLLSAEEAGFWKPDPRAYSYAVSRVRRSGRRGDAGHRPPVGYRRRTASRPIRSVGQPGWGRLPQLLPPPVG
jgi:2-haloacid dehalogenase